MKSIHYPSINGLRAISILFVILGHIKLELYKIPYLSTIFKKFYFLTDGQLGVNIFFVISGFLITILLISEKEKHKSISIKNFYIRRVLRIFPAYYFLLLIYALLCILHIISIPIQSWLTALTYTKYLNWQLDWYTGHAWSLSIEEQFYLFWPLTFLLNKRTQIAIILLILVACPLFRVYGIISEHTWNNGLTIFQRLDAIAIGCLAAFNYKVLTKFIVKAGHYIVIIVVLYFILFPYLEYINRVFSLHMNLFIVTFFGSFGTFTNLIILFLLIYSINIKNSIAFKLLNNKLLNFIGIISYSLYLWQQLFVADTAFGMKIFPYNIILIILCSLISYYVIEKPFLKLKKKFSV
ncbi:MAG: acyltransferase [Chitinophagales bacterium]|nr:acyltransferase [Chitinophagales bacterium]